MRRRLVVLLITATIATLLLPHGVALAIPTSPQGALDARCSVEPNSVNEFLANSIAAQTFTPKHAGKLTTFQVQVYKDRTYTRGDIVLGVAAVDASGVPTNTVLASTTIPNSWVPDGRSAITANFESSASAPSVVRGQKYALTIRMSDTTAPFRLFARNDNPCSGSLYAGGPLYGNTFLPYSGDPAANPYDIFYATYVSTPPRNDNFAKAKRIKGTTVSVSGTTLLATREVGEPDHLDSPYDYWEGDHSVWYRWKAPTSGPTTVDTCTANIDSILAVYTGSELQQLTKVIDDNNSCPSGWGSKVTFDAKAGKTYRIAVSDAGGLRENTFTLNLAHTRA